MTEEKLWEVWEKFMAGRRIQMPPEIESYLRGERPDLAANAGISGRTYYADYPNELVKALDGECAALASRMLRVIGAIRSEGFIQKYGWAQDLEVCVRMGMSFDEVLSACRYEKYRFSAKDLYLLAELLLQYYPAETQQFAREMLQSDSDQKAGKFKNFLAELLEKHEADRAVYLRMDLAGLLLLQDKAKYALFLPVLEQCAEALENDFVAVLLYHCYELSDTLGARLRKLILENLSVMRELYYYVPKGSFPGFLQALALPAYPYYVIAAIDNRNDCAKMMRKLFSEDHETFLETYHRVAALSVNEQWLTSLGLLAIMLQNGEGQQELKEAEKHLTKSGRGSRRFWVFCAVLYDYSSVAKAVSDDHIVQDVMRGDMGNFAYDYAEFVTVRESWLDAAPLESTNLLLANGLERRNLFAAYCQDRYGGMESAVLAAIVQGHEQEAIDYLLADDDRPISGTVDWIMLLYGTCGITDYDVLIKLFSGKSKLVRSACEEMFSAHEEQARAVLEAQAPKLKGDAAQAARRIIKLWDNERKFGKDFSFTDNAMVTQFCTENYNADNAKSIGWIPAEMLCDIRFADLTEKAPEIVAQYLLVEYFTLATPYRIKACDKVVAYLHPQDWQSALENIFKLWLDDGADTKKKGFMVPYCLYGSDPQIIRLKRQIEVWAENSRGALGAYVVNALALNGGSVALLMVDGMATKFPNNQVKNTARAAFAYAAKAMDIPEDELSDRIVPNIGFNSAGEKTLDYGARTFSVNLLPDFSLSIMDDEKGKAVKSLPKPSAKDDAVKAEAAKKEFSELKKQMKAVVQTQTNRLEKVLFNGRFWTVGRWNALFVDNAIMHKFATGLIWGVYDQGVLGDTFRYMEDGTFNTVAEEEYRLPENALISLVHPIELDEETLAQWKQQLEDYEIVQPLAQLSQKAVRIAEGDLDGKLVKRYNKKQVTAGKLTAITKRYSLIRGEVLDGGSYCCFHLVDKYLGLGAQLNFEWMYMGISYDEAVTLGELIFYSLPEDGVLEDDIKDNCVLNPGEISPRFVSSVLATFDEIIDADTL